MLELRLSACLRAGAQVHALAGEQRLEFVGVDGARLDAVARGERGSDPGRLPGDPALRNLAQEAMRVRVAGDVPPAGNQPVELHRNECTVRNRDVGKLRRDRGCDADLIFEDCPRWPLRARYLPDPDQAPAVAHAELRCAQP
jgi:hypothetical protein